MSHAPTGTEGTWPASTESSRPPSTPTSTPTSTQWLARLIGFDSTSRNSNLALIEEVATAARSLGLDPLVLPSPSGAKANLVITVPAQDGSLAGGVMLSGHTDVVPVDGQSWTTEPFTADIRQGRIYGRGASDMKGFCAAALAALPAFIRTPLSTPVHLAFTYDEEVGCLGAVELVTALTEQDRLPQMCIVGEPTMLRIITAHKSSNLFRLTITGVAAHSSLTPKGVNAIEYAAQAVGFVRSIADEFRLNGPFDTAFDVPYTSANVGLIRGGVAVNTIPDTCTVDFEFRTIPQVDPHEVLRRIQHFVDTVLDPALRAQHPLAGAVLEEVAMVPGLREGSSQIAQLVHQLTGTASTDKVAYATEAGIFQAAGIDTIICGPGSLDQAHTADEYLDLEQLAACDDLLAGLAAHLGMDQATAHPSEH